MLTPAYEHQMVRCTYQTLSCHRSSSSSRRSRASQAISRPQQELSSSLVPSIALSAGEKTAYSAKSRLQATTLETTLPCSTCDSGIEVRVFKYSAGQDRHGKVKLTRCSQSNTIRTSSTRWSRTVACCGAKSWQRWHESISETTPLNWRRTTMQRCVSSR